MGTNTKPLKSKPVYVVEGKNFTADPLRSRGRTISVVLLVILFSLLIVFVLWAASRRVATFFHERGDARSRVGQYEESIPFYNWATLFYSLDSHATITSNSNPKAGPMATIRAACSPTKWAITKEQSPI
jgi:hypothetical protein